MKLRYWYKTDHTKKPIPGSNVRRKSRPGASHQWREILDPCCSPIDVPCTCGPRYFVQLDGKGKPVDGTLIKRIHGNRPEGTDGAKFYELEWKSICCDSITWDFASLNSTPGSFVITINGNEVVNDIVGNINSEGRLLANVGDTIAVTVTNASLGTPTTLLQITGGHTFTDTTPTTSYTFVWNGINTSIVGVINQA